MTNLDRVIVRGMFALIMNGLTLLLVYGYGTHHKDINKLNDDLHEFVGSIDKAKGWDRSFDEVIHEL